MSENENRREKALPLTNLEIIQEAQRMYEQYYPSAAGVEIETKPGENLVKVSVFVGSEDK